MTIAEMVNKYDIRKYDDATIVTCGLSSEDYAQKKPEIIANKLAILEYLNNESDE